MPIRTFVFCSSYKVKGQKKSLLGLFSYHKWFYIHLHKIKTNTEFIGTFHQIFNSSICGPIENLKSCQLFSWAESPNQGSTNCGPWVKTSLPLVFVQHMIQNNFYILKWLEKIKIFCDMWKLLKFILVSVLKVLLEHNHTHSFFFLRV